MKVKAAIAIFITSLYLSNSANSAEQFIDQETYNTIGRLFSTIIEKGSANSPEPRGIKTPFRITKISDVSATGGNFRADSRNSVYLPQKREESWIIISNCTPIEQTFKRSIEIRTNQSVSYELSKTLSFSSEKKFSVGWASADGPAANIELSERNAIDITRRNSTTISGEVTRTMPEERTVPPFKKFFIKITTVKGVVKAPLEGNIIIDAVVHATFGPVPGHEWVKPLDMVKRLSDFPGIEPRDRTVQINGFLTAESFEGIYPSYAQENLEENSPECKNARIDPLEIRGDGIAIRP